MKVSVCGSMLALCSAESQYVNCEEIEVNKARRITKARPRMDIERITDRIDGAAERRVSEDQSL